MRRVLSAPFAACTAAVAVFALQSGNSTSAPPTPPLDLLIRGARVLDGSGNPWMRADVGVRNDRVAAVGDLRGAAARETIDAADRYLAPGFIDVHTHAVEGLARAGLRQGKPLLAQGVTTIVGNPDGGGPVDLAAQREALQAEGVGPNVALLIGHGSVRRAILGMDARPPTDEELGRMAALVRTAVDAGAFGLSSGLFYAPGHYATAEEVAALVRVAAERGGGLHASHIRDEGAGAHGLLASVDEIISIAEQTGTTGIVTHLKALGVDSWGLGVAATMRIARARTRGVQVFADQYPYEASATGLVGAVVPRWAEAGGSAALRARLADPATRPKLLAEIAENIRRRGGAASLVVSHHAADHGLEGSSLEAIARARGRTPAEAVADIVSAGGASVVSFNMSGADIDHIMQQPWTMSSSDGGLVFPTEGRPHPRNYGAFARKLARYVRERPVVGLEFAVRSMTTLPALVFGIADRGVVREGAFADLVLFDLARVEDTATYDDPHQLARGMDLVLVNGRVVLRDGQFTSSLPGRVLRRGRD